MKITAVLKRGLSRLALKNEKELTLKVGWGNLSALTWGDTTQPPVLMCHGKLDTCSTFRPLVQHLSPSRFYVSVELPGCGYSDKYPKGGKLSATDFLPPLQKVVDHFGWKKFTFIGHSLGSLLGVYLNKIYPHELDRIVSIDPEPEYTPFQHDFKLWYQYYYSSFHGDKNYEKLNSEIETAPKYTYEQILERMKYARGLTSDQVEHILERCLQPAGDGLFRLTFDQRHKMININFVTQSGLEQFYTESSTPKHAIIASESIEKGAYLKFPMALDDSAWKHRNYSHVVIEGGHDIHLQKTKEVADSIENFLVD